MTDTRIVKPEEPRGEITPMTMIQMAIEQGADLDKLSALMDLQERWDAKEARKAFIVAKAKFAAEEITVGKNKHVGFESKRGADTSYMHATLDNVTKTLMPILSKYGLSYSWETEQFEGGMIRVTCILTHEQGHSERVALQGGADQSGNKNNIQAVGSTVTYLQRYTLLAITGTATQEQDDDAGVVSLISEDQKSKIIDLIKEVRADERRFFNLFDVEYIDQLPAAKFDKAVKALEQKRAQNNKEAEK